MPDPVVRVDKPISITTTLAMRVAPIDEQAIEKVRQGVETYLMMLNNWREFGRESSALLITGRFRDVVTAGLDATDASGIKRTLALEKLTVDRYLVKPWGTPALAEARATIVDRAKDGAAPGQRETGRLLLSGNRLMVVDGWDAANGRWFNSAPPQSLTEDMIFNAVHSAVQGHLRVESWVPGSPSEMGFGAAEDPYFTKRYAYLRNLDRSKGSRLFSEVRATVEKVDAFAEIAQGLATVKLTGVVTTVDPAGRSETQAFERRVVVAQLETLSTVMDEEISPGVWMSGGNLMATLAAHDVAAHI